MRLRQAACSSVLWCINSEALMVRVIAIAVRDHDRERRPAHRHDDDKQQIPGWAPERKAKTEPEAKNLNLSLGRWIDRASANSGPKIAPGTGRKSS
jgi:hypothetical protein